MPRRLSPRTPYILSENEIAEVIKHLPARVETATAALMNQSVEEWRAQAPKVRVKQLIDHENAGAFAATMAAAERAIGDLEVAAMPTMAPATVDTEALLDALIEGLHKRGLIIINPSTVGV